MGAAGRRASTSPTRYKRDYWKRGPEEQDAQGVYFLRRMQALTRVDATCKQPNGIIGTPDGKTLYVSDIDAGRPTPTPSSEDGSLTDKYAILRAGSDGMTIDDDGNVYLTSQGVTVFDKTGKQVDEHRRDEAWTVERLLRRQRPQTLFITASNALYAVPMRVKGAGPQSALASGVTLPNRGRDPDRRDGSRGRDERAARVMPTLIKARCVGRR